MSTSAQTTPFAPLFIDGQARPASGDAKYEVHNPYSGELVSYAASASSKDCRDAVDAAVRAFPAWEKSSFGQRRDFFMRAAALLETDKYRAKVEEAIKAEIAATDFIVNLNLNMAAEMLRTLATLVTELKGETFPSHIPGGQVLVQRRAQGVVFSIAPWNSPVILTIRAAGYPIVCGNTVVLKTSEVSPRIQYVIAELFHESGLPNGVLNFIHTSRESAPARTAEIIAHPAVRKINFTGSDRVGKIIASEAGKYLKPCVLELGGKAPAVVLNDADVPRAARAITSSALVHSGQICMSTERVIVQRGVAAALKAALVTQFRKFKSGGPGEVLSAQFREDSAENVQNMLREAKQDGAGFLLGDGSREGAVIQPHIVTGVKPGMRLWERESFGPREHDAADEAVELANATTYSLVGSVWTRDLNLALNVSSRIRYGCVNVNGPTIHVEDTREHGGLSGASGYGKFTVDAFTDSRLVVIHPAEPPPYPLVDFN
ncbi:Aldehyde/histidinol dehydrogenase [Fomitopsis serialis]|uniref:Aldehyde/histidinol dehydrogenase n=1 Tax=Fomitopsis serialis TaxID=139415 RepID=UPI0020073496|nr:Aldehyde/histidinol dehydrogenase [Neoantrodia serialis]KAH9920911.1 Aldehyde/histidinol dehydrogenase [Neoantrodia serialis]